MENPSQKCLTRSTILLFLALVFARAAFWPLGHVQEDAYITLRVARTLVESGTYGFNAGERVSAATSHLYAIWLTLLRLISGEWSLCLMHVANAAAMVLACRWMARAVSPNDHTATAVWIISAMWPVTLYASYSGMETSLLVLAVAWLVYSLRFETPVWSAPLVLFLLPWIRPDSMPAGILFIALIAWKDRRMPWFAIAGFVAGQIAMFSFNKIYFGQWLHQTIVAKTVAYGTPETLRGIFKSFLYNMKYGWLPVGTKYLLRVWPVFALASLVFTLLAMRGAWRDSERRWPVMFLALAAWGFFAAYSAGGAKFPWYLWPSQIYVTVLGAAIVWQWAVERFRRPRVLTLGFAVLLAPLVALQWMHSVAWGSQEGHYRAGIGRELAKLAGPSDTLILEPLGYIPYYSRLYTYCEVGLATPEVTAFRKQYGKFWYKEFLKARKPEWVLRRSTIPGKATGTDQPVDGAGVVWFAENYTLARTFTYDPDSTWQNPMMRWIARRGSASEYYLYRKQDPNGN